MVGAMCLGVRWAVMDSCKCPYFQLDVQPYSVVSVLYSFHYSPYVVVVLLGQEKKYVCLRLLDRPF